MNNPEDTNIIQFNDYYAKCLGCQFLAKTGEPKAYVCTEIVYNNGKSIYPIIEGEKTDDFYACNGNDFVRSSKYDKAKHKSTRGVGSKFKDNREGS